MNTHRPWNGILLLALLCPLSFAQELDFEPENSESVKKQEEPVKPVNFDESIYNWTRTFAETLQKTQEKHYKVNDPSACMIKAIDGFLTCLDPHSGFLDPKTYKMILEDTSGEFFGIGVVIDNTRQTKDKFLMVIDTIPEGPADKAGVKPLDKIVEIEGKPLDGMTTEEATVMLKGERNSKVHIKVMRENQPDIISLDITRDEIKKQDSLCFNLPDQNIYYLSLNIFSDNAVKQLENLLTQSKKKEYNGLIIDLRNNSGGLLNAAIDIAGLFLDKNSRVVSTKGKSAQDNEHYETNRHPVINTTIPIFILINNYTASAAEILAGCLKLHSDALSKKANGKDQKKLMVFLVGTRTFGKGSVQEVIPVSNNCAIKLTTALYELPFDKSIQGVGIEPDFVVDRRFPPTEQMLWFNKFYGRERALNNYIKSESADNSSVQAEEEKDKNKADNDKKSWTDRAKDMLEKDNQFRDTITLINMLHSAQVNCPAKVNTRQKALDFLKHIYITNEHLDLVEVKI